MQRRVLMSLAGLSVIALAALVVQMLKRRRQGPDAPADSEWTPHYAPPVSAIAGELLADQPLARSTDEEPAGRGYDDELDAEQQQRHAAAERLKAEFDEHAEDPEQ